MLPQRERWSDKPQRRETATDHRESEKRRTQANRPRGGSGNGHEHNITSKSI
jgi:hypothetical protein